MACLLPTPSLWRRVAARTSPNECSNECSNECLELPLASAAATSASSPAQAGGKMRRRPPPCRVPCREAAAPRPQHTAVLLTSSFKRMPAYLADRRRTDEASRPDRELLAGSSGALRSLRPHRRLSAVLLRGSLSALNYLGSIPGRNLVGLDPQSKCFFWDLECEEFMAAGARSGLGGCLTDRAARRPAQAPRQRKARSRRRAGPGRARPPGRLPAPADAAHRPRSRD